MKLTKFGITDREEQGKYMLVHPTLLDSERFTATVSTPSIMLYGIFEKPTN
jgi:hypothetical protein